MVIENHLLVQLYIQNERSTLGKTCLLNLRSRPDYLGLGIPRLFLLVSAILFLTRLPLTWYARRTPKALSHRHTACVNCMPIARTNFQVRGLLIPAAFWRKLNNHKRSKIQERRRRVVAVPQERCRRSSPWACAIYQNPSASAPAPASAASEP